MLRERGVEPDVYYANSNIAPREEYERRLATIREWAQGEGVSVVEGPYAPEAWDEAAGAPWREGRMAREDRCRACYRLRFSESAKYAAANGYDAMGTTLSVSPYQYTEVIREELQRACDEAGIEAAFDDWRPYYDEATRRSREAGMYRQNYCGCAVSEGEAAKERAERKAAKSAERARWRAEHADEIAEAERERAARREERAAYDAKRARQRQILKSFREKQRTKGGGCSNATT